VCERERGDEESKHIGNAQYNPIVMDQILNSFSSKHSNCDCILFFVLIKHIEGTLCVASHIALLT
jgi:hypothetical protein